MSVSYWQGAVAGAVLAAVVPCVAGAQSLEIRAGSSLPKQPVAQLTACRCPRDRRRGAAGACRVSSARHRDGVVGRAVYRYAHQTDIWHESLPESFGLLRAEQFGFDQHPNAVQWISDREPHTTGGSHGLCCARDAAHDRTECVVECRHRLHEPVARYRDPRSCRSATSKCCRSSFVRSATASTSAKSRGQTSRSRSRASQPVARKC